MLQKQKISYNKSRLDDEYSSDKVELLTKDELKDIITREKLIN